MLKYTLTLIPASRAHVNVVRDVDNRQPAATDWSARLSQPITSLSEHAEPQINRHQSSLILRLTTTTDSLSLCLPTHRVQGLKNMSGCYKLSCHVASPRYRGSWADVPGVFDGMWRRRTTRGDPGEGDPHESDLPAPSALNSAFVISPGEVTAMARMSSSAAAALSMGCMPSTPQTLRTMTKVGTATEGTTTATSTLIRAHAPAFAHVEGWSSFPVGMGPSPPPNPTSAFSPYKAIATRGKTSSTTRCMAVAGYLEPSSPLLMLVASAVAKHPHCPPTQNPSHRRPASVTDAKTSSPWPPPPDGAIRGIGEAGALPVLLPL
ncbi:hypothetical protein GALMADRAFT_147358 [Galerina marginata CBS 339.88]|uniref:Uncharacterized protein n=1 Tax=Galerina marginata (strain CBS 339.88) TaxID=685588 RepID=A0A067S8E7_GALM3|nr:hypothetical protein GALMADRAFT_147358 [Galerina marginata CBS 339.88]